MYKFCVLIPAYNEQKSIKKTIEGFTNSDLFFDVFVCDNNSIDKTAQYAEEAGAIVLHETRQGKGYAVKTLLQEVKDKGYDSIVMIDGDNTYDTSNISELLFECAYNKFDMVIGDRLSTNYFLETTKPVNTIGNKVAKLFTKTFISKHINDPLSGLRVFSNRFVKNYPCNVKGFELETDLNVFAKKQKYKVKSIPVKYRDRVDGSYSKIRLSDAFKIIFHTLKVLLMY